MCLAGGRGARRSPPWPLRFEGRKLSVTTCLRAPPTSATGRSQLIEPLNTALCQSSPLLGTCFRTDSCCFPSRAASAGLPAACVQRRRLIAEAAALNKIPEKCVVEANGRNNAANVKTVAFVLC